MSSTSFSVPDFEKCFDLSNPGLKAYFGRVRKGQDEEYRTSFADGQAVSKVLKEWQSQLTPLRREWPTLFEFENDLAKKVGPMSIMKPLALRMDDIEHYYRDILRPGKPISQEACMKVLDEWSSVGKLHLRSRKATVDKMRVSTNSGSPYFTKRRKVKNETIRSIQRRYTVKIGGKLYHNCAVLGWRGQEGGPKADDVKQRVVWMFPFSVNASELQFYQPAIEKAQQYGLVPAWISMEAVDREITHLFDSKGDDDVIVCTDFSRFDQHFNEHCQLAAKIMISGLLAREAESIRWIEEIFPIKYEIPLAYDYGKVKGGKHGMGSGSGGTNFDETLVHRALQYQAALDANETLNPHSMCLGDDGIISYPNISVDQVVDSYSKVGLDMNLDKQYVSKDDCTYLRRWHHKDYRVDGVCVGVYSTCRALGRLMEQERFMDPEIFGPKAAALRQLSILENVKYHPLRENFVKFCMKRDKYRLGIDIPGFLDNVEAVAQEFEAHMPDFLGYTKSQMSSSGIATWWIVNYLKSLR